MPIYSYTALNAEGREVYDTVDADSKALAISEIRDKGFFPTVVKRTSKKVESKVVDSVSGKVQIVQKQSYFEYLSELWGNKLIEWGKTLKGEE